MASFSSPDAFARSLDRLDRDMRREASRITKRMAEDAERIAVVEASRDLGGDSRFSGWGGRDLADLRIKRVGPDRHVLFPTRKSGGPWKVAEQGRNQGTATGRGGVAVFFGPSIDRKTGATYLTKSGKVRMTRTRKRGRWNGYTRGKGTASRAGVKMGRAAEELAVKSKRQILSKHFDVS